MCTGILLAMLIFMPKYDIWFYVLFAEQVNGTIHAWRHHVNTMNYRDENTCTQVSGKILHFLSNILDFKSWQIILIFSDLKLLKGGIGGCGFFHQS